MRCEICQPESELFLLVIRTQETDPSDAPSGVSSQGQLLKLLVERFDAKHLFSQVYQLTKGHFWEFLDYAYDHLDHKDIYAASQHEHRLEEALLHLKPLTWWRSQREYAWIDDMIENRSFRFAKQPIYVTHDNAIKEVVGHEMLVRGYGKDGQHIAPLTLIEAAKARNRLFAFDRAARLTAVETAQNIDGLIFINFIPTVIYRPEHCLSSTLEAVRRYKIAPDKIVFEVVESDQIKDMQHLKNILTYYRHHGFRFALDDVGEGYNGLRALAYLEPDFIKLDRSYVNDIHKHLRHQTIAKAILDIAQSMGAFALAEGVEKEEEWHFLKSLGYTHFQGYYFAKPYF
ncbi:MAG: EAL domain-containing protein [Candidatus Carbobacillus sp.]|nr:EAL domain-containing protein [Candidatus Carbobacillus sp.]